MADILTFMGSPRHGGNTDILLGELIEAAMIHGADVEKVNLYDIDITPCIECRGCNKTGVCILDDDMANLYVRLEEADVIVVASPIFFYNITSRTQALVERAQALWIKKYVLRKDVKKTRRIGIFLSLGATKGKRLFDGVMMVMKYFFDALDVDFKGALLYRGIEEKGAIKEHRKAIEDVRSSESVLPLVCL